MSSRPAPLVLVALGSLGAAVAVYHFLNRQTHLTSSKSTEEKPKNDRASNIGRPDVPGEPIEWTVVAPDQVSPERPFAIPVADVVSPLTTPSPPTIYVKEGTDPYRPRMSLSRLSPSEWIVVDAATVPQLAEKEILLGDPARRAKCIAWTIGRDEAARELLNCVAGFLGVRYPTLYTHVPGKLDFHPGEKAPMKPQSWTWDADKASSEECMLILAGCAADDFVVLEKRGRLKEMGFVPTEKDKKLYEGEDADYSVTSSINCFSFPGPLLHNALNGSLAQIHAKIPHVKPLMPHMERFFLTLKTEGMQKRWNCTFVDFPNYHRELRNEHNQGISEVVPIDEHNAGERVWVRCERQSFIRLPVTRAVVFGIRTVVHPLEKLIDGEGKEMGLRLLRHIKSFDEETKEYRRMSVWIAPVITWLENKVASM